MATPCVRVEDGATRSTYKMHPVVVFSILDHYKRRDQNQSMVVGLLLGHCDEEVKNLVHITNSFPLRHGEPAKDEIIIDVSYKEKMLDLYQRVNKNETTVGWYCTGDKPSFITSVVHDSFKEPEFVHVTVDVVLNSNRLGVKAYVPTVVRVGGRKVLSRFEPVPIEFITYEAEKIAVDALINGETEEDERLDAPARILSDIDTYTRSLRKLLDSITTISNYVSSVEERKIPGDVEIGRSICEAIGSVPLMEAEGFDKSWSEDVQDLLMLVYLSNLTKAHLALADKVNALLPT